MAFEIFYGMLDQGGINALVLYSNIKKQVGRKDFLKNLGMQLVKPHVERRLQCNLHRQLRTNIYQFLNLQEPEPAPEPPTKLVKQARCVLCPREKDRKVKTVCSKCRNSICAEHRRDICISCL